MNRVLLRKKIVLAGALLILFGAMGCTQNQPGNTNTNTAGALVNLRRTGGNAAGTSIPNTGNMTVVRSALQRVSYPSAQRVEVEKTRQAAGLTTCVLPQSVVRGDKLQRVYSPTKHVLVVVYGHMVVTETPATGLRHVVSTHGDSVTLPTGSSAAWLATSDLRGTREQPPQALVFEHSGLRVTLTPKHQPHTQNEKSLYTAIAASFTPNVVPVGATGGARIPRNDTARLSLEKILISNTGVVFTTTHGDVQQAYANPAITTNGQQRVFEVTLKNMNLGSYREGTTVLNFRWTRSMTLTRQGQDILVQFILKPGIRSFTPSVGFGDMIAFTFR